MEEKDKPTQTDSSAEQQHSNEEAVRETVANVIKEQQAIQNPLKPESQDSKREEGSNVDVPSQQDSSKPASNPDDTILKMIEGSTGRKFNSVDEAQKYLKNLNSLVGDQEVAKAREGAKLYDALVNKFATSKGQPAEDIKKSLADFLLDGEQKQQPKQESKPVVDTGEMSELSQKVEKIEDQNQRFALREKYPFAREVENEIAIIAKQKGISYTEAFEQSPFKSLLEEKAKAESGKSPVVAPSNRTTFDAKKIQEKASKVLQRGNEKDKLDLIKEFGGALGL